MGDCLCVGKLSHYVTSHTGPTQSSMPPGSVNGEEKAGMAHSLRIERVCSAGKTVRSVHGRFWVMLHEKTLYQVYVLVHLYL